MKVLMIGTPICPTCKRLHPIISAYCYEHDISFRYENLDQVSNTEYMEILNKNHVRQAPAFIIYKDNVDAPVVVTGDSVFIELNITNEL